MSPDARPTARRSTCQIVLQLVVATEYQPSDIAYTAGEEYPAFSTHRVRPPETFAVRSASSQQTHRRPGRGWADDSYESQGHGSSPMSGGPERAPVRDAGGQPCFGRPVV